MKKNTFIRFYYHNEYYVIICHKIPQFRWLAIWSWLLQNTYVTCAMGAAYKNIAVSRHEIRFFSDASEQIWIWLWTNLSTSDWWDCWLWMQTMYGAQCVLLYYHQELESFQLSQLSFNVIVRYCSGGGLLSHWTSACWGSVSQLTHTCTIFRHYWKMWQYTYWSNTTRLRVWNNDDTKYDSSCRSGWG